MTTEHDPYEAGVGIRCRDSEGGLCRQERLKGRSEATSDCQVRRLTIDDGRSVVLGMEPVFSDGRPVGYVTSAAFGYTIGKPIAYAYLPSSVNEGDAVEIEYGNRIQATVTSEPLVNPQMTRLRD